MSTITTTPAATAAVGSIMSERNCAKTKNALRTGQSPKDPNVVKRLAQVSAMYSDLYRRVIRGKGTLREAIRAQCLECVCWQRKEVTLCTDNACPLFPYRPYQQQLTDGGDCD